MSLESDLTTVLKTVCPRTFPDFAPVTTERPYVTYQQVGGDAVNFFDRLIPNKRNALIQINVWANTRKSATETIQAIEDALRMTEVFQAEAQTAPFNSFDAGIPVYSSVQDFSIWADR